MNRRDHAEARRTRSGQGAIISYLFDGDIDMILARNTVQNGYEISINPMSEGGRL